MPLAMRVSARRHSIERFRAAAFSRFREGQHLASSGHRLASIYFLGYCAEMLLKVAYFRLAGWGPHQPITKNDLNQAKAYAVGTLQCVWAGNLHHLPGWLALLVEERKSRGIPYSHLFLRGLTARVNRLAMNWSEVLRYHDMRPYLGEVESTLQAAAWLVGEYKYL